MFVGIEMACSGDQVSRQAHTDNLENGLEHQHNQVAEGGMRLVLLHDGEGGDAGRNIRWKAAMIIDTK